MNITIRIARNDDESRLSYLFPQHEPGYFAQCLAEQREGRRTVPVAESGGEMAAYAMLNWRPQYALYRRLNIPEIQDLNTLPAARRQGIATVLIEHCEELIREKGHDHAGISVGLSPDFGAAQRLYVKLGYVPDGSGVTYDRETVSKGEMRPVDDNLCLMMVKAL